MIHGMTVTLLIKTETGRDPFNAPIYAYVPEEVEDVLVGMPTAEEKVSELNLSGRSIAYILGIPKGDEHDWEDQIVEFFGHQWKTFGIPEEGIEANIPLRWNKKVKCERYV